MILEWFCDNLLPIASQDFKDLSRPSSKSFLFAFSSIVRLTAHERHVETSQKSLRRYCGHVGLPRQRLGCPARLTFWAGSFRHPETHEHVVDRLFLEKRVVPSIKLWDHQSEENHISDPVVFYSLSNEISWVSFTSVYVYDVISFFNLFLITPFFWNSCSCSFRENCSCPPSSLLLGIDAVLISFNFYDSLFLGMVAMKKDKTNKIGTWHNGA